MSSSRMNNTDIPSARDVAKVIERRQRDLTFMISKLCDLRKERFNGLLMVRFRDGKAVKWGVKKD